MGAREPPDARLAFDKQTVRDLDLAGRRARARARRLQRPARGRRGSPTTRASAPRCRRSSCCSTRRAARSSARTSAGRRTASPETSLQPASDRLRELIDAPVDAGAGGRRRRGRAAASTRSSRARSWCSRTRAGSRGRPRTIPSWRASWPRCADVYVERRVRRRAPRPRLDRRRRRAPAGRRPGLLLEREVDHARRDRREPRAPARAWCSAARRCPTRSR